MLTSKPEAEALHAQEHEVLLDLTLALNVGSLVLDPEEIDGGAEERLELAKEVREHVTPYWLTFFEALLASLTLALL